MAEYIERETFLKEIEERYCLPCKEEGKDYNGCKCRACWVDDMRGDVIGEPAADVAQVVHGEWQGEGDGYADGEIVLDVWYCSECGYCIDDGTDDPHILPNYCPHCGARMDGDDDG